MSNLVGTAGAVDLGGSAQAASAGYSAEDAMAVTIVRLYQEGDELRAEVAMLQEQARILAGERDEAREAFSIATGFMVDAQQRLREMEDQRDFAMGEMERLERERDEAREALRLVMDWAPTPPDYMDRQSKAQFDADFEKARKILEAAE